jgi:hypothetical protein
MGLGVQAEQRLERIEAVVAAVGRQIQSGALQEDVSRLGDTV